MSFKPISVEEKFIQVGGLKLFVRLEGKGGPCPLVFLHGGPGSSHDYFVPYVSEMARKHRLVFYDQRGCGRSERTQSSNYLKEDYVEEVRQLIRKLGYSKVNILGHSWGGFLAQMYALKYQSTINRLILCCTASNTLHTDQSMRKAWSDLPRKTRSQLDKYLGSGDHSRGQPYPSDYLALVQKLLSNNRKAPLDVGQYTSLIFAGFSWPVYAKLMGGGTFEYKIDGDLEGFDTRSRLGEIKVPTLIMAGKHDGFTPEEAFNMQKLIPNSRVVIFVKSSHWPFLEENSKFVASVIDFLRS